MVAGSWNILLKVIARPRNTKSRWLMICWPSTFGSFWTLFSYKTCPLGNFTLSWINAGQSTTWLETNGTCTLMRVNQLRFQKAEGNLVTSVTVPKVLLLSGKVFYTSFFFLIIIFCINNYIWSCCLTTQEFTEKQCCCISICWCVHVQRCIMVFFCDIS